jgi:hypothetical protein
MEQAMERVIENPQVPIFVSPNEPSILYRALRKCAISSVPLALEANALAVGILRHDKRATSCASVDFDWFKLPPVCFCFYLVYNTGN